MAVHAEIVKPNRVLGGRETVLELQRVDLDVTVVALHDFNNFVDQIAATIIRAAVIKEKPKSSKIQLRRSTQLTRFLESDVSKAMPLPAAQVCKVSALSSLTLSCFGRHRGRCGGHRAAIGTTHRR